MKILLTTLNSKFIHTNLAIRYLNQMVKDIEDIEVDIREYTINNELDFILKDIYKNDYDVILFSTYIWNVNDIVKLCGNIKKVKPNMKIALGGPEVSYDSEDSMKKYDFVDYILYGEGEQYLEIL
ncbi:B12 binding domain protein [[Clostridium] sordellii ATCC 9714]|nr:B12 binding domain protein [[Clostridium] sordellii ATCC 9714] [Paeniclostridium sordellii ATCC 9714]